MASYVLTAEAQEDIDGIAAYTTSAWGWRQAGQYLANLEDCFSLLANTPSIGRTSASIRTGLRRFEIGRHVVFTFLTPMEF